MKLLLPILILAPAFICGAQQTSSSASLSYVDRKDVLGSCKALLTGVHLDVEEDTGFGSKVDFRWAKNKHFHIVYTNSEINFKALENDKFQVKPSLAWKNLWRGVKEDKTRVYSPLNVTSISSQHGMAYVGAYLDLPLSQYLKFSLHPQLFYEAVAVRFVKNVDRFHGRHCQKDSGWAVDGFFEGSIGERFRYSLGTKYERAFSGLTTDLLTTVKLTYGF